MTPSEAAMQVAGDASLRAHARHATPAEAMAEAMRVLARQRQTDIPAGAQAVIDEVLASNGLTIRDVARRSTGTKFAHRIGWVRDEAVFLARLCDPDVSYPALARLFHRDHTSLVHGQRVFAKRLETDELLRRRILPVIEAVERQKAESAARAAGGAA